MLMDCRPWNVSESAWQPEHSVGERAGRLELIFIFIFFYPKRKDNWLLTADHGMLVNRSGSLASSSLEIRFFIKRKELTTAYGLPTMEC